LRDKPSLRSRMIEWLLWRLPIMTRLQKEHDRLRIFNEGAVFAVLDHADHLILRSGPQHETLSYGGLIAEQHVGEGFIDDGDTGRAFVVVPGSVGVSEILPACKHRTDARHAEAPDGNPMPHWRTGT
jgi:hypothetical protein